MIFQRDFYHRKFLKQKEIYKKKIVHIPEGNVESHSEINISTLIIQQMSLIDFING